MQMARHPRGGAPALQATLGEGHEAPATSQEVALHELGESVAATVATVRAELARYPDALGAYVLDEVELIVPVVLQIDALGQTLVRPVDPEAAGPGTTQYRMRIRPVMGAATCPPRAATEPLARLGVLSATATARLESHRIFSVDDLQRVARNAAGQRALATLDLGYPLEKVLERAALLSLPTLPPAVAEVLLTAKLESPRAFVKARADRLARVLSKRLDQEITPEHVKYWQTQTARLLRVPLPDLTARPEPLNSTADAGSEFG